MHGKKKGQLALYIPIRRNFVIPRGDLTLCIHESACAVGREKKRERGKKT